MNTSKQRLSLLSLTICLLLTGLLCFSCRSQTDAPSPAEAPDPAEPEPDPAEPAPCEFVHASKSLLTTNIETEDGSCTLVLPLNVSTGDYDVQVSSAGRDDLASVQISINNDLHYYPNEGRVTVTEADATHIRGFFTVSDGAPPDVGGPWTGQFDVQF